MNLYLDCICNNFNHVIRFSYERNPPEIVVEVRMNDWLPWYKRVLVSFKYLFKINRGLGVDYDCTILKNKDLFKIEDLIEKLRRDEKEDLLNYKI